MAETKLVISGVGIPPRSAMGVRQTLTPIGSGDIERDVNGGIVNMSRSTHQKYRSVISADSLRAPAFDGLWPGAEVTVDCVAQLSQSGNAAGGLSRTSVPGSVWYTDAAGNKLTDPLDPAVVATIYCPRLSMVVTGLDQDFDEWGAAVGWSLTLVEA